MRIGIECFRIFRKNKHGMDIAAIEMIKKLQLLDKVNSYILFCFEGPDHFHVQESSNFKIVRLPRIPSPLAEQFILPLLSLRYQLDILHSTGNTSPLFLHCRSVITLHDIIYLEKNPTYSGGSIYQKIGKYYRKTIVPKVIQKAAMLITVSETEKSTICNYNPNLNNKINFIYNGVSSHFMPKSAEHTLTSSLKYKLPVEPFLLFHGNTDPKKNTLNVLKAFDLFLKNTGANIKLVITDLSAADGIRLLKKHDLKYLVDKIHFTYYVNNSDMPDLYNRALLFLYPSLRESFGIPILEAMACDTPVITSNCSAMPEISGKAALLVDPTNSESIATAITTVYHDQELRAELIQKGKSRVSSFSWLRSAEKLIALYSEVTLKANSRLQNASKKQGQPAFTG